MYENDKRKYNALNSKHAAGFKNSFQRSAPGRGNQDNFSRDQHQVEKTRTTFQETGTR